MTRNHAALTLALSLLFTGCASDNMTWSNPSSPNADTSNAMNNKQNYEGLPDNPQVGAVNDKNRLTTHALSGNDMTFIRDAEAGGMYEISASEKALIKSSNPDLKSLAQHMVDDHTKAANQLKNLASRKGLPDNAMLTAAQIDQLAQLDKAAGADFDREYLRQQKAAHQDTIAKFESAAASADDKDLRDWASSTLPTLRGHLTMIDDQSHTIFGNAN